MLIPIALFNLLKFKKLKNAYTQKITTLWAKQLLFTSGSSMIITGLENIPEDKSFCILSNHQSNFDIPILMSIVPGNIGFVGKSEMLKVPFLSTWMKALHCVFIKRTNIKDSIEGLKRAINHVKDGQSMVLFPEGTRSRNGIPGKFHHAGIRMALQEKVLLIPVTIKNSYKMFEQNNRIIPVKIEIVIHNPLNTDSADDSTNVNNIIGTIKEPVESGFVPG